MSGLPSNILVRVRRKKHDEEAEFPWMAGIAADISRGKSKIGYIEASLIKRDQIPDNEFYGEMDGPSSELQFLGVSLFENRYGRTTLRSLAEDDSQHMDILYIEKFRLEKENDRRNRAVGAVALDSFFRHELLSNVCIAMYVLDPKEHMSKRQAEDHSAMLDREHDGLFNGWDNAPRNETRESRRQRLRKDEARRADKTRWDGVMDKLAHCDAIPFFRCGFFQDPYLAALGKRSATIIVASRSKLQSPVKSEKEARGMPFSAGPPDPPPLSLNDLEVVDLVKSRMARLHEDSTNDMGTVTDLARDLMVLVGEGASISRSRGLHLALSQDNIEMAMVLLKIDPECINVKDENGMTPLMVAAGNAAGRFGIHGLQGGMFLIDFLLKRGADRDLENGHGQSAYGLYLEAKESYNDMMLTLTGRGTLGGSDEQTLEAKLMPLQGPKPADSMESSKPGFINYKRVDREDDQDFDIDYGDDEY